jgi:exosome complex component RRP45
MQFHPQTRRHTRARETSRTMRPFEANTDTLVCLNNREFIVACLRGDDQGGPFRMDGRAPSQLRSDVEITIGPREGTCTVRIGQTIACASTTARLERPQRGGSTSEGVVRVDVDFSSGACEGFAKDGRMSKELRQRANDLGALLERGLKEARAVDVESLCVLAGKRVWVVTCAVTVLAHDGNLAGATSLAACGSLMTFRRPECAVDPNSGMVTVHDVDAREPILLNMHHFPVAASYCFFDEHPDIGVCDPNLEEEITADASLVVLTNSHEEVCAVSKTGEGVKSQIMRLCVRDGARVAREWTETLKEAAADFEADRLANKVRTHYDGYKDAPDDDYLLDAFIDAEGAQMEDDAQGAAAADDVESDSAEDEDDEDETDGSDADADDMDADTDVEPSKPSPSSTKKKKKRADKDPSPPRAAASESDEETKFNEDDDIDALFAKAEKKKQKKLGNWDGLPGDGDSLAAAVKPRKKLKSLKKKPSSSKK